jgi:hypothetical protein
MARQALLVAALGWLAAAPAAGDLFSRRVAPILSRHCLRCHDGHKKRGGLDLSTRAGLLAGGESGPAVVPGNAANSRLLQMVSGPKPRMPRSGPRLSAGEVAVLRRWIESGAAWPAGLTLEPAGDAAKGPIWWSLRPLVKPTFPAVKDRAWCQTPVDVFILAGLEARGLKPAPEADRRTLIRRLTFDLTGLPPTPDEVVAFLADRLPGAYERVVDRLLASPAYGERWGRHWLDVARYGDTHGYDKDKRRDNAWPYRDWVIRAFNADLPYRDFIRRQIAGDVLKPGDPNGIIATGFVVAGPWDFVGHVELREGTLDKEKTRLIDRDDMVSSVVGAFMSLTVGCARCHDHKFDPIEQRDYYRLQAVFSGVERGNRRIEDAAFHARRRQFDRERARLAAREADVRKKIARLSSAELKQADADLARAQAERAALPALAGAPSPSNGYHSAIMPGPDAVKWVQIDLGASVAIDEVRLFPARPTDFRDTPGFGFPVRFRVEVADEPAFRKPTVLEDRTAADVPNPGDRAYRISAKGHKGRFVRVTATRLWKRQEDYVFALAEVQVESAGRNVARGRPVSALDSIEAGRWSRRYLVDDYDSRRRLPDLSGPDAARTFRRRLDLDAAVSKLEVKRSALAEKLIPRALRDERARLAARCGAVEREGEQLSRSGPMAYAVVPIPPRPIWVLRRGDVEQRRRQVAPGALTCLPGLSPDLAVARPEHEGSRRLALADWIADGRNVLTWRSIVNRAWQYHFGRGLVDTTSDFGKMGALPSHPELLDWLALTFREQGGSLKKLHRLLVTSAAYRQSSRHGERAARIDADNRLLWRMNRRRLDAEGIRDAVLAVTGRLDRRMGGPGYEPFRFKDDHSPVYDHADLKKIHDPATYRRTVYRFTVRSVPNPFLDCLDAADPNQPTPVRNTTLTALQALALLNNPFMVRQASYFADRLKVHSSDPGAQLDLAFRLAFARPPDAAERRDVAEHARSHGLAATCRVLFNANEFVFVD